MKNQINNPIPKTNQLAIVSLFAGILSILPYVPLLINMFLFMILNIGIWIPIPFLLNVFSGITFGLISLITGGIAIRQIKGHKDIETGHRFVIIGMALSILGVIANILFGLFFFIFPMFSD